MPSTGICEAPGADEWQEARAKLPQHASRSSAARRGPEKQEITTDVLNASLTVWNQLHLRTAAKIRIPTRRPPIHQQQIIIALAADSR
jgi:hypothetical protein